MVINNGGGRIFSQLPALAGLGEPGKETTENRHQLNFESWAAMWGFDYVTADPNGDFAITGDNAVIEIQTTPEESDRFWEALRAT